MAQCWRSKSQLEVDVVIEDRSGEITTIEIKSKSEISRKDTRGLLAFAEDYPRAKKYMITLEGRRRIDKTGIEIIPAFEFLQSLWNGEITNYPRPT